VSKASLLERERRFATPVSVVTLCAVALYMISLVVQQSAGLETGGRDAAQLVSFHENSSTLLVSSVLSALALVALCVPLLYLFRAAQGRSERVRAEMVGFVFLGPVLFATQVIIGWIASDQLASDFVQQMAGVSSPEVLADNLIDDSTGRQVASGLLIPAVLGMTVAMIYIPLQALRCGLVSRFWGSLAMALGASMFLIPPVALIAMMIWFVYLALVIGGWIRGGRPPAWEAGEAIPWPTPGQEGEQGEPEAPSPGPATAREANGTTAEEEAEHEGRPPQPTSKKRKRKRRR
jgi:hypothetical protein